MSWIVQYLLNNRESIKEGRNDSRLDYLDLQSLVHDGVDSYDANEDSDYKEPSYVDSRVESEEFNDLICVEQAVNFLKENGKLSDVDLAIIGIYNKPELISGIERHTFSERKAKICERIAFYLGGVFTDEGYLNSMQRKHKLTDAQVDNLRIYMKSNRKNKLLRKPIND